MTQITPETVNVGDRVVLTQDANWTNMYPPLVDFSLPKGALGTVTKVDRRREYVMVAWDDAPVLPGDIKQEASHIFMPNFLPNNWNIEKV